jgi:hypothetical protein
MNAQQQPPSADGDPDGVLPSLPLALPDENEPEHTDTVPSARREPVPYGQGDAASPYTAGPWQGPVDHPEQQDRPLNRPVRWFIAAVEVAFVVGLAFLAAWAWSRATVPVRLPDYENPAIPDVVERQSGPWTAAAVGLGLLAALLLMDAARQAVLAARLRDRPAPAKATAKVTATVPAEDPAEPADDPVDGVAHDAVADAPGPDVGHGDEPVQRG